MAQPIQRRVRVLVLKKPGWETPEALEAALSSILQPQDRIIFMAPDPKWTHWIVITEQ